MTRRTGWILAVTTMALLIAAAAVVLGVGAWAKDFENAAIAGKAQAEAGVRSLAAQEATAAASQFEAASNSFGDAKRSLGFGWVVSAARAIPWVGRQYAAARTLVEIGLDGSAAGTELSGLLQEASASSGTTDTTGGLVGLLVRGHARIESAMASLSDAADRGASLSTEGLLPQLAVEVGAAQSTLLKLAPLVGRARSLLPVLSYLTSGDRRLLVLSQDGAEIRPTGGFVGSYGLIDIGPRGFKLEKYADIYTLPYGRGHGSAFQSANQSIDFPSSARAILAVWRGFRQPPVDGVIAIDTVSVQDMLSATGPIQVPGYGEAFTSENLLVRLLYLVEVVQGGQPTRKNVLAALATQLIDRVLGASPGVMADSALAYEKSADAKHIQMYFTDPGVQGSVEALGWSGRVAPPAGTTDVVAVSNTMNVAGKINYAIKKTIAYEVGLRQDGSAETTLVLGYANVGAYLPRLTTVFKDLLRVYRNPGVDFPAIAPSGGKTATVVEFGFPAEVRTFYVLRGQSRVETLTARVPDAIRADAGAATTSSRASHYRLYVVRQDDLEDVPTTVTVTAPPGWRLIAASARLTASGAPVSVTLAGDRVLMALPLSGDLELDVRLASP
jgi:hypothetical protein